MFKFKFRFCELFGYMDFRYQQLYWRGNNNNMIKKEGIKEDYKMTRKTERKE